MEVGLDGCWVLSVEDDVSVCTIILITDWLLVIYEVISYAKFCLIND